MITIIIFLLFFIFFFILKLTSFIIPVTIITHDPSKEVEERHHTSAAARCFVFRFFMPTETNDATLYRGDSECDADAAAAWGSQSATKFVPSLMDRLVARGTVGLLSSENLPPLAPRNERGGHANRRSITKRRIYFSIILFVVSFLFPRRKIDSLYSRFDEVTPVHP
jgi:hypothetical protein